MEIKEVDYMLSIVDAGSMLRASENLFITQSALSKYIQNLETRLGFPLFIREKKNRLVLTEAGEIYLRHARRIAQERDAMERDLAQCMQVERRVRVGLGLNVEHCHLSEILQEFKQLYPHCEIDIKSQRAAQNRADVLSGALDFSIYPFSSDDSCFSHYPLTDDYLLLAIPENHPLASEIVTDPVTGNPWIDYRRFENEHLILQDEHCWIRTQIDLFMAQNHFSPNVYASTNSTNAALLLVEQGIGVCLCSSNLIHVRDHVRFATIGTPAFFSTGGLIFRKGETISPILKGLAMLFKKYNCLSKYADAEEWSRF